MRLRPRRSQAAAREPAAQEPDRGPATGAPVAAEDRYAARRRRGWRAREAGAATVGAIGSIAIAAAGLVMGVAVVIAVLVAAAIVLVDVGANASNSIVEALHEGANFFAGSFTGLISFPGHYKRAITVDWGIAAVVYLLVGALIAGLIARMGRGGVRFERRHRMLPTH